LSKIKHLAFLALIPLLISAFTFDYFEDAFAVKAKGKSSSQFGSAGSPVCGDRLCSEISEADVKQITPPVETEQISDQKAKYEKEGPIVTIPSFDESNIAQSYIVRIFGGEFERPLIFKTFSRVEPGDTPHYIKSFHDLGFSSYFLLESVSLFFGLSLSV